jgi:hypothetical protein
MKSKLYISLIMLVLGVSLVTCGSTPKVDETSAKSVSESVVAPDTPKVSEQPVNLYYTGSGGKGISIAILAPKATGLTENQNYIPTLVQGEFVSNFSGYSAISVLDRVQLDSQYAELLSGYYEEDADTGMELGHLPPTEYIMGGNITKTATGYALQTHITKTADKMTAASYSGTCTFAELDDLTGIRRASSDLLQKMGVELTDRAKAELAGAAATNHVNAQTSLAQGITAQKSGTVVEALSYYYQAESFEPAFLEAVNRANVMSAAISSGNIGENVRNDIQRRKEWQKLLTEAEDYFSKHLPWEIVYDPILTQGKVDYAEETVDLSFDLEVKPTDGFKTVNTILTGLAATGKAIEWDMEFWPLSSTVFVDRITHRNPDWGPVRSGDDMYNRESLKKISISLQLINSKGEIVATTNNDIWCPQSFAHFRSDLYLFDQKPRLDVAGDVYGWDLSIVAEPRKKSIVFESVSANDITDNMTVKIISVNGIDAETLAKNGYIKISTGGR